METIAKGVVLINIKAKPYNFENQKGQQMTGTSYKATLSGSDGVFVVKTDDSVYKDAGGLINQEGDAKLTIKLDPRTGTPTLFLNEFIWVEKKK